VQAPATHQAAPAVPKPTSTPKVQVKASVGDTSIDSGNTLDQLP